MPFPPPPLTQHSPSRRARDLLAGDLGAHRALTLDPEEPPPAPDQPPARVDAAAGVQPVGSGTGVGSSPVRSSAAGRRHTGTLPTSTAAPTYATAGQPRCWTRGSVPDRGKAVLGRLTAGRSPRSSNSNPVQVSPVGRRGAPCGDGRTPSRSASAPVCSPDRLLSPFAAAPFVRNVLRGRTRPPLRHTALAVAPTTTPLGAELPRTEGAPAGTPWSRRWCPVQASVTGIHPGTGRAGRSPGTPRWVATVLATGLMGAVVGAARRSDRRCGNGCLLGLPRTVDIEGGLPGGAS